MFNMCKQILSADAGEDPELHSVVRELVLQRLMREVKTSELRTMCLQVVIAALYYNPHLLFETMDKLQLVGAPTESLASHFIKQWIHDTDCFLGA
ncbi:hypothetical protein LSTR_LSTR002051 [Laodelphax striatellus]|uniref:Uncharacterized protein n=1 Tax=Laodelphax striatellus TaxID=195883 RepID=A0A482XPC0_LAOST|nr:hypothetical protein LSTR_LSTR002051 [Laodelphax striatellus]